jgi:hypothetical protein
LFNDRKEIRLKDFAPYKDFTLVMGAEDRAKSMACGNAGIILYNLHRLHVTRDKFVEWIFHGRTNLDFVTPTIACGPNDQGALNVFYKDENRWGRGKGQIRVQPSTLFNWKPYWPYSEDASILHFHG